ncbi:DUF5686 family protein [Dokdonia sp.]|uniref:DUF5686 and carboxypeptidase-like regulatory domain-containing protein n=1 Tax=Dokdonia sp. TaxID=2024995 RepID=UPI003267FC9D
MSKRDYSISKNTLWIHIFLCCFCFINLYGQQQIHGKIVDATSGQPLPFATVIINTEKQLGVVTNIDGFFTYSGTEVITQIRCSYVGYKTKIVQVNKKDELIISLETEENSLEEVFLISGVNPALAIVEKVIENRAINNPENLQSFNYTSYNKTVFDIRAKDKELDTLKSDILKGASLFMMESATERKFLYPDLSHEHVIATKVSGFKNPLFASLATNTQPFSFYKDEITLFDINYLSPITSGSLKKYNYTLEETIVKDQDTIHIVSYQPKPSKNFEGLKGIIHVNTKGYAVQHVTAAPYENSKIEIVIEQKYNLINDTYWFPEELNYKLRMPEVLQENNILVMEGRSYIKDITIGSLYTKKEFPLEVVTIDKDAGTRDLAFWETKRIRPLNENEQRTYRVIDSIGEKYKFDKISKISEGLVTNKIPFNYFDLPLDKLIDFNKFEEARVGFGLESNDSLHDKLRLGGFVGYGSGDEIVKYGGHISYAFADHNDFKIKYSYENDLIEAGSYGSVSKNDNEFEARRFLRFNFDLVKTHQLGVIFRSLDYLTTEIALSQQEIAPQYTSQFINGEVVVNDYKQSTMSVKMRYAFKEQFVKSFNNRFSVATPYPVLQLAYTRGIQGFLGGDFGYNKIQVAINHSFYTKNLGKTTYKIEGGYIDTTLPYGLLFTGQGSFDEEISVISKNTFQTMPLYTFLSDRYVRIFTSHDFGRLLFKSTWLEPNIIIHHNMGIGDLENPEQQERISFQAMDRWYIESGLELRNIIKLNFLDIGYLGFGVGGFYNYGFYEENQFKDNFAFKFNLSFSFN